MSHYYWNDALHYQNFNYPYVSIPNDGIKSDSLAKLKTELPCRDESDVIRHIRCEKNMIKTDPKLNTILKIFETSCEKNPKNSFVQFHNNYFCNKTKIPENYIRYSSYSYSEIAEFSQKLSHIMAVNKFSTLTNHQGRPLSMITSESSQSLESVVTFLASYYNDYTNLLIDHKAAGEEIYKILEHAEIETLFCSNSLFLKLVKFLKSENENLENHSKIKKSENSKIQRKLSKLKLKNIIFYENSSKVDEEIYEFTEENSINEYFFWNLINNYDSHLTCTSEISSPKIAASPSTPAIIIYSQASPSLHETKSVIITHQALITKMLGYYIYFQKALNTAKDSNDTFALGNSLFDLDSLCLFLLAMYLNISTVFLQDEFHLLSQYIKDNISPSFLHLDMAQFTNLFNKTVGDPSDIELNILNTKIKITNQLGNSIKLAIIPNRNHVDHYKLIKYKSMCPFQIIISQGYREETIGSVIFSYMNNLISGNFGLLLPCYEAKIVSNGKNFEMILRDNLDKSLNSFTGNLYLKSEALFSSYYKRYSLHGYENEYYYKENLNFLNYVENTDENENFQISLKWLPSNLITILAKNLSFKIIDRYEDIHDNSSTKNNFNFSYLKSFVLDKESNNYVKDTELSTDDYNNELNILFKVDVKYWEIFIETILKEKIIQFDVKEYVNLYRNSNCVVIYDKYENLFNLNEDGTNIIFNKEKICLRNGISDWMEKNLEGNHLITVSDINKITIIK